MGDVHVRGQFQVWLYLKVEEMNFSSASSPSSIPYNQINLGTTVG
jgi:hypothetical protein